MGLLRQPLFPDEHRVRYGDLVLHNNRGRMMGTMNIPLSAADKAEIARNWEPTWESLTETERRVRKVVDREVPPKDVTHSSAAIYDAYDKLHQSAHNFLLVKGLFDASFIALLQTQDNDDYFRFNHQLLAVCVNNLRELWAKTQRLQEIVVEISRRENWTQS